MPMSARTQTGLTLVELMIALTIGLLVSLAVGTVFVQGSRAHAEDDRYARMLENGRFALDLITRDLRMVSFWGEMLDPSVVSTALVAGEDCGIDLFDGACAVMYNNAHSSPAVTQFDVTTTTCAALTGTVRANTNQIAIKHTLGVGLGAGAEDGVVYLRSNGTDGALIDDADTTPLPSGYKDWAYAPMVYYIGDDANGTPYLCRLQLTGTAFTAITSDECVASGIEHIHVQFGIDSDGDGVANQYRSNPTAAQIAEAMTARVHVLVRSATQDSAYANTKTYTLGDLVVNAGGDGYYRRAFSSTVRLRNPSNMAALR